MIGDGGLLRAFGLDGTSHIFRPSVEHVVVLLHAGGIHVGSRNGPTGVGEFLAGDIECFHCEFLWIAGLVENRFPHQHTGVVAVTPYDLACVLVNQFCPVFVFVPVLPTGRGNDNEDTQFVERVHKRRVLRIVGSADDVHSGVFQSFGVAPLLTVGHGVAHEREVLMAVAANQLAVGFAVEPESVASSELSLADAHADDAAVESLFYVSGV